MRSNFVHEGDSSPCENKISEAVLSAFPVFLPYHLHLMVVTVGRNFECITLLTCQKTASTTLPADNDNLDVSVLNILSDELHLLSLVLRLKVMPLTFIHRRNIV